LPASTGLKLEMGPDPTWAYFWPRSKLEADTPLTWVLFDPNRRDFFWSEVEKIEKFDIFRGNFLNPNHKWLTRSELVMGPGQKFCGSGRFGSATYGLGLEKKISSGWVKNYKGQRRPDWPLIYCGSKVSSGRVMAHLYPSHKKFTQPDPDQNFLTWTHH